MRSLQMTAFSALICLSSLSLLMVILKSHYGQIFGVYKEVCTIFIILLGLLCVKKTSFYFSYFVLLTAFSSLALLSIIQTDILKAIPVFNYVYELKIVGFYFLLLIALHFISQTKESTLRALELFKRLVILFFILNISAAIVQRVFFTYLLSQTGFDDSSTLGSFGSQNNVVIQTQSGLFRTIGTFSSPMALAEFIVFSSFFMGFIVKSNIIRFIVTSLCLITLYFTSYKTAYTYLPAVLLLTYLPYKLVKPVILTYAVFLLLFGFIALHTDWLYSFALKYNPTYAEFSIKLRQIFLDDIISQMDNLVELLFGAGYGVNGGLIGYLPGAVPLDSLYIWILSNYGFLGVFLIIFFTVIFALTDSTKKTEIQLKGYPTQNHLKYYLILVIAANFFWNNPLVNFPSLLYPITAYFLISRLYFYENNSVGDAPKNHAK